MLSLSLVLNDCPCQINLIPQASPLHQGNDIIPWSQASVMKSSLIKASFLKEQYKTRQESSSGEILRDSLGKTGGNKHFAHLKANKTQWIFNGNIKGNLRSIVAVSYLSWYHWCSQMLFDKTVAFKSLVVSGAAYAIHPAEVALWPFSKPRGRFDNDGAGLALSSY